MDSLRSTLIVYFTGKCVQRKRICEDTSTREERGDDGIGLKGSTSASLLLTLLSIHRLSLVGFEQSPEKALLGFVLAVRIRL